jgi:hypothetical protein
VTLEVTDRFGRDALLAVVFDVVDATKSIIALSTMEDHGWEMHVAAGRTHGCALEEGPRLLDGGGRCARCLP